MNKVSPVKTVDHQCRRVQADRPRCVAGCVQHGQGDPGHFDPLTVGELPVGRRVVGIESDAEWQIVRMQEHRRVDRRGQRRRDPDMIIMGVGADESPGRGRTSRPAS